MTLTAYDFDGVITAGVAVKQPCVVISGRTFAEYDDAVKYAAQFCPVYIRGSGEYGDHFHAGQFKAAMINLLGVTEFHEDHPTQIAVIRELCPDVTIVEHTECRS